MDETGLPEDFADFQASVLSDLRDDRVGVYEVWWEANERYPDLPLSHRLAVSERIVTALISDGRASLEIERESEPWTKRPGERPRVSVSSEPIPAHEVAGRLRDPGTWVPQEGEMVVLTLFDDSVAE